MSLPTKAVDRLFERLAATYGRSWTMQWADVPMADVKAAWAHELAGYTDNLAPIAWALENLPERTPNAIEFRNLCRRAPAPAAPRLPEPKADPERVRVELERLHGVLLQPVATDGRAWARELLDRHMRGERVSLAALEAARGVMARIVVAHAET